MKKIVSLVLACLLTVTLFPRMAQASSVLSTDSYYINEKSSGKYLWVSGSIAGAKQGKISTLGTSIQWKVTNKDSTWSTVTRISNSTKYLCNESGSTVNIKTVSGTTPDSCLWSFTMESGGIRIKNKATGIIFIFPAGVWRRFRCRRIRLIGERSQPANMGRQVHIPIGSFSAFRWAILS